MILETRHPRHKRQSFTDWVCLCTISSGLWGNKSPAERSASRPLSSSCPLCPVAPEAAVNHRRALLPVLKVASAALRGSGAALLRRSAVFQSAGAELRQPDSRDSLFDLNTYGRQSAVAPQLS